LYQEGFINTLPVRGGFDPAWQMTRFAELNVFTVNLVFCNRIKGKKVSLRDQLTGNTNEKINDRIVNISPCGVFSCEHGSR
jgi:hypothetical protein